MREMAIQGEVEKVGGFRTLIGWGWEVLYKFPSIGRHGDDV